MPYSAQPSNEVTLLRLARKLGIVVVRADDEFCTRKAVLVDVIDEIDVSLVVARDASAHSVNGFDVFK